MKKTRTKRFIALLLTIVMAFTICGGVFAEDDEEDSSSTASSTGTITITNAQSGVTYTAYKIFDVTIATASTSSTDEDGNTTTTTENTGYAYTIAADSAWLSSVLTYANATSDPTSETTSSEDTTEDTTTEDSDDTTTGDSSDGTSSDSTTDDSTSDNSSNWSSGLTLTLSADGSCYVVEVDGNSFSAAKFASYLLSVLKSSSESSDESESEDTTENSADSSDSSDTTSSASSTFTGTTGSTDTDSEGNETGTYTISNLELGYYLVVGTTTASSDDESDDSENDTDDDDSESTSTGTTVYQGLAELTTTDTDVEIYDKNAAQTISKEADATAGSVEIGENISFYIYGTVPSLTGYTTYTYEITDSMTDGLTFTEKQMAAMDIELYEDASKDMTDDNRDEIQLYVVSSTDESGNTIYSVVNYVETEDESCDSSKTYYTKSTSGTTTYTAASDIESFASGTTYYEAVTVGSLTYVAATKAVTDEDGNVTTEATGGGFTLSIDMTKLQDYEGYEIGILYKATANENADATTETNTATLTYSNDPDSTTSTSTATATATVYTSNIIIYKVDSDTVTTTTNEDGSTSTSYDNATKLSGASFVLIEYKSYSGLTEWAEGTTYYTKNDYDDTYTEVDTSSVTTPVSGTKYYVLRYYQYQAMGYTVTEDTEYDSSKTYYTASTDSDGNMTYTKFSGTSFTSSETYYEYSATGDVDWTENIDEATVLTTDESGTVTIKGLDDLTYYLLEIEAPDGYNLLTSTVTVKVSANDETYSYSVYVENSSGSILPATGGMGRTIVYVIGILIIICACAALIVRRRISCKK